jgi:hypothetical protein
MLYCSVVHIVLLPSRPPPIGANCNCVDVSALDFIDRFKRL